MHIASLESLRKRHLDGHSFTGGTLQERGTLLGGIINNSVRNGLKNQQLTNGSKLISATHEMTTDRLNNTELIGS